MQARVNRSPAGTPLAVALGLLTLGLGSCSQESDAAAPREEPAATGQADPAAEAAADLEPLPTEEELESTAKEEITEENADQAFEDLKREIETDG